MGKLCSAFNHSCGIIGAFSHSCGINGVMSFLWYNWCDFSHSCGIIGVTLNPPSNPHVELFCFVLFCFYIYNVFISSNKYLEYGIFVNNKMQKSLYKGTVVPVNVFRTVTLNLIGNLVIQGWQKISLQFKAPASTELKFLKKTSCSAVLLRKLYNLFFKKYSIRFENGEIIYFCF